MQFLAMLAQIAAIAQSFIPLLAIAHKATTPDASNAALNNASAAITAAQGLVAAGEQAAAAMVAQGATPPTGPQKLAIAQAAVQQAHAVISAVPGATTATFDEYWNPINAAITAICAANKKPSGANNLEQVMSGTVGQA